MWRTVAKKFGDKIRTADAVELLGDTASVLWVIPEEEHALA